jgi:hypothetical protein
MCIVDDNHSKRKTMIISEKQLNAPEKLALRRCKVLNAVSSDVQNLESVPDLAV